jgi:hypothetical protein
VAEASEESGGADRRALRAELERLEVKVEDHPALAVIQQMEELDRVMLWYGQNAAEVLGTIDALNHDGLGTLMMIQDEVPFGEKHRDFATELGRTWHNFVASAHTVADHMRGSSSMSSPTTCVRSTSRRSANCSTHRRSSGSLRGHVTCSCIEGSFTPG